MNNKWLVIFIFVSLFFAANNLFAYETSKTGGGADIKWFSNNLHYFNVIFESQM